MKRTIFVLACGAMIFCSCSETSSLQNTDVDLDELIQQYEQEKADEEEKRKEGDDISPKVETREDETIVNTLASEYVTELMNRTSIAKEKVTRSAYSTSVDLVGVFKVGSCGNYKELEIDMDCEDSREKSSVSGEVGDTSVDGNGNVKFRFCLTESNRFYPGGVLLIGHINYKAYASGLMSILVRHHDTEDSGSNNSVYSTHPSYNARELISTGHTKVTKEDIILAWAFPCTGSYNYPFPQVGPSSIHYGLLVGEQASTGIIFCDDEDKRNKNWAKEYEGHNYKRDSNVYSTQFGATLDVNTTYRVGVSTNKAKFYDNNSYFKLVRYGV